MDYNTQDVHQRELQILDLLKKYKAANPELASTSLHHLSKHSSSNQPTFSRYNTAMTSSHQFKSYPYNKSNQSYVRNQRTVLYNYSNNSKYKLTANKTVKSSSLNAIKFPVVPSKYAIQSKRPDSCSGNSSKEASKLSSTASISKYSIQSKRPDSCSGNSSKEASKLSSTASISKYAIQSKRPDSCSGNSSKEASKLSSTASISKYAIQTKRSDSCSGNSSKEASKLSSTASISTKSDSLFLIKEIESVTESLRKKTENESKSIRDGSNVVNKLHDSKNIGGNFKYCAINKPNVLKNESKFSKINGPFKNEFKTISSNVDATIGLKKNSNDFNKPNFASGQKNISTNSNSLNRNKYCYKKVNAEKLSSSKVAYTSLKSMYNGNKVNDIQKSISQSCIQKISVPNVISVGDISCGTKLEIKPLSEGKLKQAVATSPVKSRTKINNVHPDMLKSRNILKVSSLEKINGINNKYKRVNGDHSVILSKNYKLKRGSHLISPSMKKSKGKLNTKFKIINKNVSCINKKMVLDKNTLQCKENSPLTVDKSDPVYKLLNDFTVDKIEEDLLAIKSTLTSTPTSAKIYHKGLQNKTGKMDPKLNRKQMSLKKSKTRISKYKFINSVAHSSATNNKQNFTNLKNIKKTKFSLINKHISDTPVQKGKSVLIKRLFKSRNAIINKNASSTHHSAKMIKFKYFALNKRKLPFERPILYSKGPFLKPKFKGYLSAKLYSKKSRPQKASIVSYSQRKIRKFSPYVHNTHTALFNSVSGSNSKKKLQHRYGRSPVVYIRGLKYSCNSSGKTLRKLPVQDFSKFRRKMAFSTRRFPKTPENRIKGVTPTSSNLASRVLHRSITQVLSASSKKKLIKVNKYCMFYNRFGRCNRGVKCTYIHDPSKIAVCTRFLRGTCKVDGCPFSHEITPGKMAICSFFLVGACDKDACPYRHENLSPDAELCKAFVKGYCPSGKECKKAHVLICPKYIQGTCEKGTSCAFPHPPQKEKRNVQKETDEENKQDDGLFEKVARYFQPNENASLYCEKRSDDNAVVNVVVPKQRRLEEQPSFIPLSDTPRLE